MEPVYSFIVVDDLMPITALVKRLLLLRYPDAVVWTCGNGREALTYYDRHGADMLITNHWMPGMHGPELIQTLRDRGDTIPIISLIHNPDSISVFQNVGATALISGFNLTKHLTALVDDIFTGTQTILTAPPLLDREVPSTRFAD